jgi:hypothetical protein
VYLTHSIKNPYKTQIQYNGKFKYIGCFKTAKEAAEHFDACARFILSKTKGYSRKLNFPQRSDWSHLTLPKWLLEEKSK